jgi:hypothetical protein
MVHCAIRGKRPDHEAPVPRRWQVVDSDELILP